MPESGQPVLTDFSAPKPPEDSLDALIDYLSADFPQRKAKLRKLLIEAQQLRHKEDVIKLGYEVILFRMELDEWVSFAGQLLDEEKANQLGIAHDEKAQEAKERGSTRPSSDLVKSQAGQFIAPLKRAHQELNETQKWMSNVLSWCQSQQKMMASEEYGDLFTASNASPDEVNAEIKHPPKVASSLKQMRG
jgi:hypothetical protein